MKDAAMVSALNSTSWVSHELSAQSTLQTDQTKIKKMLLFPLNALHIWKINIFVPLNPIEF